MIGPLIARRKLRSGFNSVALGDLDTLLSVFRDDAVLIYPMVGRMEGKDAIHKFYTLFLHTFPGVEVEVHNICHERTFDFVGTNVFTTYWDVATTNRRGMTFRQTGMQLIRTRFGRVEHMHYFFADLDALRHAWKESE